MTGARAAVEKDRSRRRGSVAPYRLALLLLLAALASPGRAGEGIWSLSFRTQGGIDFRPGNDWFLGPQVGYSNFKLASHRLELKAAYLTNRLEESQLNTLKYDFFLASPTWHFRRNAVFDPTLQLDVGYAWYDTEHPMFDVLPNETWQVALQPGFVVNLSGGEYNLYYHLGYNFITPQGHYFLPAVFGLGIAKML